VDGAANIAAVALLARVLAVPKSAIAIVAGSTGRDKQVLVRTDGRDELIARLETAVACVDKAKVGD
jgi:uncharacterized protein YggU (UPF0235/DUF167 family)